MFPGLLGELTAAATARSEAHPAAVASQFLVMFGNAVGRGPYFYVGETRHGMQEFCLIVGPTATGRKGDARHLAEAIVADADPAWAASCVRSGLSSGEGVIYHVRDARSGIDDKTGKEKLLDVGVTDKRLVVVETEFSQPLRMFRRDGNVLSEVLRDVWDGKAVLGTLVKKEPTRATEAHISVIGHVTREDLRVHLADLEIANGLANRFPVVAVERTQLVPSPHASRWRYGRSSPRKPPQRCVTPAPWASYPARRRPRGSGASCIRRSPRNGPGCRGRCSPAAPPM
jgi:hypothetical protein